MKTTDIAIIGAGPTGLFAGYYAGMRGLTAVIIDQLELPGGQLTALYPEKYIYDIAGFPEIKAQELVDNLLRQLKRFEDTTKLSLKNTVNAITKNEDGSFILDTRKEQIHAKSIIIAGGNGAFAPRPLGIENEQDLENLHYFVNNMEKFRDKKVAIFGGGDSAVDWSLMLTHIAKEVHIIHRRDKFRAHDHSVEEMKKLPINIHVPHNFSDAEIIDNNIKKISIQNNNTKEITTIEVDDVICNFGFISNLGPIKDWGLDLESSKIKVNSMQQTNIKGIHAIGDICTYDGKAALIASGFGEGPTAINSCYKHIDPNAVIGVLHSSSVIGGH